MIVNMQTLDEVLTRFYITYCQAIQTYIQEHSTYPSYVPEDKTGNWRQATVRTNCRGDIMLLLVFHPHKLTEVYFKASLIA